MGALGNTGAATESRLQSAKDYVRKHNLTELFEEIMSDIVVDEPGLHAIVANRSPLCAIARLRTGNLWGAGPPADRDRVRSCPTSLCSQPAGVYLRQGGRDVEIACTQRCRRHREGARRVPQSEAPG